MIQDAIGPKIKLNTKEDVYISKLKLGFAYSVVPALMVSPEMIITGNKKVQFSIGSEYNVYKNIVKLRGGYNTLQESVSFGAGLHYSQVNLDYSYSMHTDLGAVNKFGFILEF